MFKKLSAVGLFVKNLDRSIEFYRDKVGLKLKTHEQGFAAFELGEIELAILDLPTAAGMIKDEVIKPKVPAGEPVRHSICVDVGNIDETYQALTKKGVVFVKPPFDQPWGQRTAYFKDPDNNIWEIYEWKTSQDS